MELNEVRDKFLKFMEAEGHSIIPSAPIIPKDDPTTLFTGSGMQPLLPYLLGTPHEKGNRLADSQKCFRANDIDEIGDNRHTTFFEMLGNWSLGDYFKKEQIQWCFKFLVDDKIGLGLNPEKLYVTVFGGDEEIGIPRDDTSAELWKELFEGVGIKAEIAIIGSVEEGDKKGMKEGERIFFYGAEKNWWSRSGVPKIMPLGEPGGPDSEVFYDFGEEATDPNYSHLKPHPNSDSGRFLEICNSVFMEYLKTEKGFVLLPKKNVDFGAGLERLVAAKNDKKDIFQIDVFQGLIKKLGSNYSQNPISYRIVLDHLRSVLFIASEGIVPSNTGQGYVLRRLIRKAIFTLEYVLKVEFDIDDLLKEYISVYSKTYPEITNPKVIEVIKEEAEKFSEALERGKKAFEKYSKNGKISGDSAFILQSTYGLPFEITEELAKENGIKISREEYLESMEKHKDTSRDASGNTFKGGLADAGEMTVKYHTTTHLLNQALRDVLGNEVGQCGSNITSERLRFDFSHNSKLTEEEKTKVESLVNEKIKEDLEISYEDMPSERAKELGAICMPNEKYGDTVRVYRVGNYSLEFCGGPHVKRTGELEKFRIIKEESISKGVRRIKAVLE